MRNPIIFLLFLLAACSSPDTSATSTSSGTVETDAETAYPCGDVGSAEAAACPDGVAYCGHDMPVPAPFAGCAAMPAEPDGGTAWSWWCCK